MTSAKTVYFLAGLPRSGSTLLANILAQNSRFHVTQVMQGTSRIINFAVNMVDDLVSPKSTSNVRRGSQADLLRDITPTTAWGVNQSFANLILRMNLECPLSPFAVVRFY